MKGSPKVGQFNMCFKCSEYQFHYQFLFFQIFSKIMSSASSEGNHRLVDS